MKKKLLALILVFILCISTFSVSSLALTGKEQYDKLMDLIDLMKQYGLYSSTSDDPMEHYLTWLFENDPDAFTAFANSLYQSYDSHSGYFDAEDYSEAYPTQNSYVGIGITLPTETRNVISDVTAGGPAALAGILPGDVILSVNGTDVKNSSAADIATVLRGEAGTSVALTVLRGGVQHTYTITRAAIGVSNIESFAVDDAKQIGYIKISRFGDIQTYLDFCSAYDDLITNGMKGLIIDLRGNPGGDLNVLTNILNHIIPDAGVQYLAMRSRDDFYSWTSTGLGARLNQMVVLTDGDTASCSEIMAGALKDLGYAKTVGKKTYGKGVGQYHITLDDASTAVITAFEFILPKTGMYNGVGILPDYNVANEVVLHPASKFTDQLDVSKELYLTNYSVNTTALKRRLCALFYLPDGKYLGGFDETTLAAVNAFQKDHSMPITTYCNSATLKAINAEIAADKNTNIFIDHQMDKALELCTAACEADIQYKIDENGIIRNND